MIFGRQTWFAFILISSVVVYELYCPEEELSQVVSWLARVWKDSGLTDCSQALSQRGRIAVGVNSNLDLIVSAVDLLKVLNATVTPPLDHASLGSIADLQEVVAYSMQHCAGIERVFTDRKLFQIIAESATQLPHVYHIGGNAALMAEKIQIVRPSADVMLVGPIGPKLKSLLSERISTPSFTPDSRDEIHMILEYSKGEVWGEATSSCANRVIFSHDVSNAKLVALETFEDSLTTFKPDLIVLSGAHLLDGQPQSFWQKRLSDIKKLLDNIPRSVPVHWELATVGDLDYFFHLSKTLFPRIDSLGLNEQELLSAAKAANANFDFNSTPKKPGIEWISDLLHWLMITYSEPDNSRLSRVHFHSLYFHIVATLSEGPWENVPEGLVAGVTVAGLQACSVSAFTPSDFELKMPLEFSLSKTDRELSKKHRYTSDGSHIVHWRRGDVEYHLSPVLVCRAPLKTVGLGDAISSLGLIHSKFINKT